MLGSRASIKTLEIGRPYVVRGDSMVRTPLLRQEVLVALYDPGLNVMALCVVDDSDGRLDQARARLLPYAFADSAIPQLIKLACGVGATRHHLYATLVGGASDEGDDCMFYRGARVSKMVQRLLERHHIELVACHVGGDFDRSVEVETYAGTFVIESSCRTTSNTTRATIELARLIERP